MTGGIELVRVEDLEQHAPAGHWGVAMRFIERAGERLTVQFCEMASGGGAEPHAHGTQDQMFVLIEGELSVRSDDDDEVVVRAGEALRIAAGASHATFNGGDRTATYLVLTYPAGR